jgi:TP901 family phage tail tape measure protein
MPIQIPVVQTGLERSIQEAATKAGKNLRINMGPGAKSIDALSRPLGRLTGKADEFTKSMEAANARVLAFGASVGVIAAVSRGFQELVRTTIDVEKNLANINSILKQSESQLNSFKDTIFDIARNTGQTFGTVAEAALELSRQGLKAEEVTKRLNDALILSRLSGLSAADSVSGLTAAINSFSSAGITSEQVLNKISAAAASAAVSDRDLIEGLKRSGSVAVASGVQFDELIGIIGALQERTARGGAVIGNSLKTIFVRIQDIEKLKTLQGLGVQVTDLEGKVLSSSKVIENLGPVFAKLSQTAKVNLADDLVGKFQIAPFLALLEDYNQKVSRSGEIAATSFNATNEAYQRNEALSKTLAAAINTATVNLKELANALGEIGVTENLSKIIGVFNSVVSSIQGILDGDGIGSKFAKGLIKGIGSIIAGPGLALALVAIGKLLLDFAKFGSGALKTFFGLNAAAEAQKNLQGQIAASLLNDKGIRLAMLSIEKQNISEGEKKKLQTLFFTGALNEQLMLMKKMQGIAISIAPGVMKGTALNSGGKKGRAAGGFLPIGAERSDISKGVGGSPSSAKPVVIPNFAFGGGRRGTMVANDSEYIVPNYANGGDAIFNQNMASSMGLPANARKVRAAGGYIPNFANAPVPLNEAGKYVMMHGQKGSTNPNKLAYRHPDGKFNTVYKEGARPIKVPVYGLSDQYKGKDVDSFIKDLELYSYKKAIKEAKSLSGGQMPNPIKQGSIKAHINKGAVAGFAGGIYELSLATLLTDEEFLSYASQTDTSNFDLKLTGQKGLLDLYNIDTKPEYGEVKGRNNPDNVASAAAKIYRVLEKGELAQTSKLVGKYLPKNLAKELGFNVADRSGRYLVKNSDLEKLNASGRKFSTSREGIISASSASGYIPNFAEGALENAIGREKGAGLPVSQIRINQSGKLRNSQNPMGLAVTNTRDEPTGAIPAARGFIPNYSSPFPTGTPQHPATQQLEKVGNAAEGASKELNNNSKSLSKNTNTSDGLTGKFFAIQTGLSLFGSGLSEASKEAEGVTGFLASLAQGAATATQVLFAMQAFGIKPGFKKGSEMSGKRTAANVRSSLTFGAENTKLHENTRKLGGKIGAVAGGFMRFLPVIGAVTTGLMLLDPVIKKMFGTGIFEGIGRVLGLVQSPAEKASKALGELADQTAKNLTVGSTPFRNFQFQLEKILEKKSGTSGITGDENQQEFLLKKAAQGFLDLNVLEGQGRRIRTTKEITRDKTVYSEYGDVFTEGKETVTVPDQTFLRGTSDFKVTGIDDSKIQEEANKVRITLIGAILAGLDEKEFEDLFKTGSAEDVRKRAEKEFKSFDERTQKQILDRVVDIVGASFEGGQEAQLLPTKVLADVIQATRIKKGVSKDVEADMTQQARQPVYDQAFLNNLKAEDQLRKIINTNEEGFFTENKKFHTQILDLSKQTTSSREDRVKQEDLINKKLEQQQKRQSDSQEAIKNFNKNLRDLSKDKVFKDGDEQFVKGILSEISKFNLATDEGLRKINELESNLGSPSAALFITGLTGDAENFQQKIEALLPAIKALKQDLTFSQTEEKTFLGQASEYIDRIFDLSRGTRGRQAREEFGEFLSSEGLSSARGAEDARMSALSPEQLRINRRLNVLSQPVLNQTEMGGVRVSAESNELERQSKILELEREKTRLQTEQKRIIEDFFIKKEGIQNLDAREIENRLETLNIHKFLEGLNEKELNIINNKQAASKIEISQLEEKLRLTKETSSQEEKILEQIKKRGPIGYGFVTGFEQNVTDAESSAVNLGKALGDASANFAYNIGNAMVDAIAKGESLGDALLGTAAEFLNLISRAFMQNAVDGILGSFGVGKQGGGPISGGSGTKDDVPAMLMGGEFVMNKKAVRKYGMGFMSGLNNGSLQGFASGGQVKDREGMFTTPGMNGAGAISGGANLLSFATQTPTALNRDTTTDNGAFLDAESGRMTMFGKRNNSEFQKVQDAKQQAFDLYASELNARQQAKDQEKANKKALMKSLEGAVISAAVSAGVSSMASGYKAGSESAGGSWWNKFKGGTKGMLFGGNEIGGKSYGGLKNLFSERGYMSGPPKAIRAYDEGFSGSSGSTSKGGGFGGFISKGLSDIFSPPTNSDQIYGTESGGREGGDFGDLPNLPPQAGTASDALLPKLGTMSTYKRATGGLIPASGGVDTVPAMLSGGEFVMNAAATKNIGADNLQSLNSGSGSSDNSELVSKLDELIIATGASKSMGDINITINGSAGTESKEEGKDSSDRQRDLSEKIKTVVKQVIADEQRLGGQLRK